MRTNYVRQDPSTNPFVAISKKYRVPLRLGFFPHTSIIDSLGSLETEGVNLKEKEI